MPDIRVSAAVIVDDHGRALVVRKRGTTRFMQPGGKPEAGESAARTLIRELEEELSLRVDEADLTPLGTFVSAAANEPDHRVVADAFALRAHADEVVVQAELAELRWLERGALPSVPLAPLSTEHLLPIAWA
jgi:8-oxo-dGTP pyrophosphatase MutT (NUDIX family)